MAIDLATAQQQHQRYLDAETAVLLGQETRLGDRTLRRADLDSIRAGIQHWSAEVERAKSGAPRGPRIFGLTPGG